MVLQGHVTNKNHDIFPARVDEFLPIKSLSPFDRVVLLDHVTNWNHCISTTTISMGTKLAMMVIYLDRFLIIKSYKALIMWSCKIRFQTKIIISLLQECLWQPNFGRMIAFLHDLLPIMLHDPLIIWPCEIRGSLTGGGSSHKRLTRHRLLV